MSADTVVRKIYFYRIYHNLSSGVKDPVDVSDLLNRIGALTFGDGRAYLRLADGKSLCAWPTNVSRGHLILGMTRSRGLPQVEENGARTDLPLTANQNLLECTHAVLFRDGIVGSEFNFYGPRFIKLRDYATSKVPSLPDIYIDALSDRDVAKKLGDLETITQLDMRLHRDYADLLRQASGPLAAAYEALGEIADAPVIEVKLQQQPRSRRSLGQKARDVLTSLVGQPLVREAADILVARGRDRRLGRTRNFDFLRDNFASAVAVTLQSARSRAVVSDDMFSQIERTYDEMQDELRDAPGIEL